MARKISNKSRHVRWNSEPSGEKYLVMRYHFVIVDDRFRESKLNQLEESLNKVNSGIEEVRRVEDTVLGSKFRYLFVSFNARTSPEYLNWKGLTQKRDNDLVERKKGSIENYVAGIYSGE